MDVFSRRKRSEVMSRIRGRGNQSTERAMVTLLRAHRITGWRRHLSGIFGRPDFYFPKHRIALFIDGCFFHACKRCFQMPRLNRSFWAEKIGRNRRRDRLVTRRLKATGIRVLRVWEHDVERGTTRLSRLLALLRTLKADRPSSR
jgi:DNA mismatch endonuclease (patch repair protein)